MADKFLDDQKTETYKSMISISVEGFKILALLNGGAAAGILAAFDKVRASIDAASLKAAVFSFVIGLALVVCAFLLSYMTQLFLLDELLERRKENSHMRFFYFALVSCLLSLAAFSYGALRAACGIH
ncbi:hypothetical protein [Paraburkholderia tropica]|uniref:hypothetical protein n=1 Tax=Paraburkholderia tropica TaxID=92647 RepID=UPI001606FC1F|nr:hypothetical protein [Paraburkholderia tropica]MBB6320569.1 hypothetical protein [Paraburkholderia tropica]